MVSGEGGTSFKALHLERQSTMARFRAAYKNSFCAPAESDDKRGNYDNLLARAVLVAML